MSDLIEGGWRGIMDEHIGQYFEEFSEHSLDGNFHRVLAVHEKPDIQWEMVEQLHPRIPRGWYELARLPSKDRIEFVLEFWLSQLPFHPQANESLSKFFGMIDDIGIYLTQKTFEHPFEAYLVYSLAGNKGFYRGGIPATEDEVRATQAYFPEYILPEDYLSFLKIHNGLWKTIDETGLLNTYAMQNVYVNFQEMLELQGDLMTPEGKGINPKALIPFYESFGMPFFQCFWGEWYPLQEMGNVYYSGETNTISRTGNGELGEESMSFPTFQDWLFFYLESID